MGTKIQANAFLREYHSAIDLDGSTRSGMRSLYNTKNGQNPDSLASYSPEKVRQIILEQESIFRNQLQELHRLYGRQQELMSEIKRREINDDMKKEKPQLSSLFSNISPEDKSVPRLSKGTIFPTGTYDLRIPGDIYSNNVEKQMLERFSKLSGVEKDRNYKALYDRDTKLSLCPVQIISQHKDDALTFDSYFKRTNHPGDSTMTTQRNGVCDSLVQLREVRAHSSSIVNLVTKDFFQNSVRGRMNGGYSINIPGLRNGRSGNEPLSGDHYTEKRSDFVGDFGKPPAFPQSLLAEPRKEFPNYPFDMGTSLSKRTEKIFGVDISEANDLTLDVASNVSSSADPKIGPHQENHLNSSSWITNSFSLVQNLKLSGKNDIVGKNDDYLKGETSNQGRFGLSFAKATYQCTESDSGKCFENSDDMNQKNPEGGLPWFLKTSSQANGNVNKEKKKSSYFMNLDSLQNCSQKFFRKAETSDGIFQKQKNEINEVNDCASAKRILGIPISDMLKSFKNLSPRKNPSEVNCSAIGGDSAGKADHVLHNKGLNNYIADLRHQIDLNLSLDEEDVATPAPSLTTAIVKIATTEIDLEAPVIDSVNDVSPKEANSGILLSYEEKSDESAAEAIIALSLSGKKFFADRLKLFAEIISSEFGDDREESIPHCMDYFEFMTLKLEDTKGEDYHYAPFVPTNPSDDEAGAKSSKNSRRGNSRRGRQRKDFQRDILPGLVTLSRLEVSEDFQAFEGLMKADGPNRSGRVRKRLGGRKTSPETKLLCSDPPQQPIGQLEERGLTGWGKRTRRVPRQRCHNAASVLSFPVRC